MIGTTPAPQPAADLQKAAPVRPRNILMMERSDRMAGMIPVWGPPGSAKENVAGALTEAAEPRTPSFNGAMAYAAQGGAGGEDEEFGFGDILDMVNPLQHIPIVSRIYRHITGDHIKPVSQVVGDSIYGGPIGGMASLTNVVIAHETGRDVAGNIMALARGEHVAYRSSSDKPEHRLDVAARDEKTGNDVKALPGTALAFADLGGGRGQAYRSYEAVDERAAARMIRTGAPAAAPVDAAPVSHGAFRSLHLNND